MRAAQRVAAVGLAWLCGLVVTVAGYLLATRWLGHPPRLMLYDAGWYEIIARSGYRAAPGETLRFFPLFPLLARWLGAVLPGGPRVAALVLTNACALGYGWLLRELATREGTPARPVPWLLFLAPTGFVLVTGYAEALAGLLAAAVFLGLRSRRWGLAAVAGLLGGLTRPVGVLLTGPALIEAARGWAGAPAAERVRRLAAVAAPVAGTAAYLAWVGAVYGDPLRPLQEQTGGPRGSLLADPLAPLKHSVVALLQRSEPTVVLHLPAVLGALALLVLAARRLPASYAAFAGLVLVAALGARTLDSFERYALSAFPLVLAAAAALRRRTLLLPVLAGSAALGVWYAGMAFAVRYTP